MILILIVKKILNSAMEHKYAHLLKECLQCGEKNFSVFKSSEECEKCRSYSKIESKSNCTFLDEVKLFVEILEEENEEVGMCELCGLEYHLFNNGLCILCYFLEQRGKHKSLELSEGFPSGNEEGVCDHCDNLLWFTTKTDCICFGCHIDPLNNIDFKPAKRE
jgi:hypothetical protein